MARREARWMLCLLSAWCVVHLAWLSTSRARPLADSRALPSTATPCPPRGSITASGASGRKLAPRACAKPIPAVIVRAMVAASARPPTSGSEPHQCSLALPMSALGGPTGASAGGDGGGGSRRGARTDALINCLVYNRNRFLIQLSCRVYGTGNSGRESKEVARNVATFRSVNIH